MNQNAISNTFQIVLYSIQENTSFSTTSRFCIQNPINADFLFHLSCNPANIFCFVKNWRGHQFSNCHCRANNCHKICVNWKGNKVKNNIKIITNNFNPWTKEAIFGAKNCKVATPIFKIDKLYIQYFQLKAAQFGRVGQIKIIWCKISNLLPIIMIFHFQKQVAKSKKF